MKPVLADAVREVGDKPGFSVRYGRAVTVNKKNEDKYYCHNIIVVILFARAADTSEKLEPRGEDRTWDET